MLTVILNQVPMSRAPNPIALAPTPAPDNCCPASASLPRQSLAHLVCPSTQTSSADAVRHRDCTVVARRKVGSSIAAAVAVEGDHKEDTRRHCLAASAVVDSKALMDIEPEKDNHPADDAGDSTAVQVRVAWVASGTVRRCNCSHRMVGYNQPLAEASSRFEQNTQVLKHSFSLPAWAAY